MSQESWDPSASKAMYNSLMCVCVYPNLWTHPYLILLTGNKPMQTTCRPRILHRNRHRPDISPRTKHVPVVRTTGAGSFFIRAHSDPRWRSCDAGSWQSVRMKAESPSWVLGRDHTCYSPRDMYLPSYFAEDTSMHMMGLCKCWP